tara:strand:- start:542 stop:808 length:267 start_codon:yes stop_codon:yes gene_type:complete
MNKNKFEQRAGAELLLVIAAAAGAILLMIASFRYQSDVLQREQKVFDKAVVVEYDGCEYVATGTTYNSRSVTHKGNCKYCAARLNATK